MLKDVLNQLWPPVKGNIGDSDIFLLGLKMFLLTLMCDIAEHDIIPADNLLSALFDF